MPRHPFRRDLPIFTAALRAVTVLAQTPSVWVKVKAKKQPLI
jgi:hypothetical protein